MKGINISSEMLMLSLLSIILVAALNVRGDPICPPGTYGDTCAKNCSERCREYPVTNRVYCDKTSGRCAEGCIAGWYDDKCNSECSQNCIERICNHQTGKCTIGCLDGKKGTFCELQGTEEAHAGKTQENSAGKWAEVPSGIAISVAVFILLLLAALYIRSQKIFANIQDMQGDTGGVGEPMLTGANMQDMQHMHYMQDMQDMHGDTGLHQGNGVGTPLHRASVDGDLDTVKQVMSECKIDVNTRGLYGLTPLMLAALRGHHDVFEHLHKQGADMTQADRDSDHILSMACPSGNMDIVKYVVSKEPKLINRKSNVGKTPLMWAAWHGRETIFLYLLDNGADCMLMDTDGNTILHYACRGGHTGIARKILAETAIDINSRNRYGRTAVMTAVEKGHGQMFDILVGKECDISHKDNEGNNVLHVACRGGHLEIVEHVLSQGNVDINCRGKDGATPLMIAAFGGHRGVFDLLVGKGADASLLDNKGNNILHMACMAGDVGIVQHILSQGIVNIDCRGQCGRTPLLWAAWRKHSAVIRLLLDKGADLLQVDDGRNNILHVACETENEEIVKCVLSKNKLDINAQNIRDETASKIAKRTHQDKLHELLLAQ